ncbi:hypothetical protein WOLCODRAFT_130299 [Wolfiporia cocos MD-104 SS10]|uniref:non-specific serine/threonine protein kinase n=1 Tax=Wolfiporia cocos (strain MD-104) TaxID=742152 RepID=A0A2H3IWF3_WOLCO|nr:hypothetical protein WOLCODRAFT_130299 [Wolfiporia cocos MD-104 SS10]
MAMAQAYPQAYMQQVNKGTLIPGQTIAVNKYTVQVERYLSQGGFAHVYLVRTATPVYNTTHHVLKRIAVPNETMLSEVKKEVDIMRILKGHPNIVYLIDAAWHRLPNGTYEVFILMEFCAGGGIIDMMNRRLRERLTEPEILTIFCDVCEGLAAMHALKPPLLHRDLKVENILQASATSYKLCDFGSACTVQKIPANTQELRMLEADLNRHTTLQYRAPEMVDVYLRRPVDEKSDVWALGVLLYKLCYYTTPFEEHGPLAILNVQYKIPPYPVYSNNMNALIASMLREHGTQRPTVFETLAHVHKLRGTKSRFTYNIPPRETLSPRTVTSPPLQTLSPNIVSPQRLPGNPLDDLVSLKSQQSLSTSPAKTAGIEARDKVLEAIAPMRRGRPSPQAPPSPSHSSSRDRTFELDLKFGGTDDDRVWRGVRGHKSGLASVGSSTVNIDRNTTDAWVIGRKPDAERNSNESDKKAFEKAFGDDFSAGFGKTFGDSFQPAKSPGPAPQPTPSPSKFQTQTQRQPSLPPRAPSDSTQLGRRQSVRQAKDAFEGLGLSAQPPPPTLGEARKSRTGLASFGAVSSAGSSSVSQHLSSPSSQPSGYGSNNSSYRPSRAHSPGPLPQASASVSASAPSWRSPAKALPSQAQNLSPEERFPSLEELDREFGSPSPSASANSSRYTSAHAPAQPAATAKLVSVSRPSSRASYRSAVVDTGVVASVANGVALPGMGRGKYDGTRSQHVTGTAMRGNLYGDVTRQPSLLSRPNPSVLRRETEREQPKEKEKDVIAVLRSRPSAARRHKNSSKSSSRNNSADLLSPSSPEPPSLPPRPQPQLQPQPSSRSEPRDWLTGNDDGETSASLTPPPSRNEPQPQPVLREAPRKRASFIERSPLTLQKPLEAESILGSLQTTEPEPDKSRWNSSDARMNEMRDLEQKIEVQRQRSPVRTKTAVSRTVTGASTTGASSRGLQPPTMDSKIVSRSGVTPSPNGLTDNWSPITAPRELPSRKSSSSSSDDGPEDVRGYIPRTAESNIRDRARDFAASSSDVKRQIAKSKGRQGSVHDLVDLWDVGKSSTGTSREQDKVGAVSRAGDKRRSVIMPSSSALPPPPVSKRSESPQPLMDASSAVPSRILSSQRSSSPHRIQPSATPATRHTPQAPALVSSTTTGRSRPQSMFVSPLAKSASTETNTPSSNAHAAFAAQSLSPPSDPRARTASRRSSISDMVQRYEAIGSNTKDPSPVSSGTPSAAPKPSALNLKSSSRPAGGDSNGLLISPSSAAARFPRISPTSSPVLPNDNLSVPAHEERTQSRSRESSRTRTSTVSASTGRIEQSLSSRSDSGAAPAGFSGLPGRRSPSTSVSTHPMPKTPTRKNTLHPDDGAPQLRSPSPERPYQGVSRLIDRWNRAVDDSAGAGTGAGTPPVSPKRAGFPARRAGAIGADAGGGRR